MRLLPGGKLTCLGCCIIEFDGDIEADLDDELLELDVEWAEFDDGFTLDWWFECIEYGLAELNSCSDGYKMNFNDLIKNK